MDWQNVIESVEQGILICGEDGRIEYFNDSYGDFIGEKLEDVKGRLLTELRPGASVPRVLESGEAIRALYRVENGKDYFADIYPVKKDGRTVGTVSVVTYVANASFISDQLDELHREATRLKARMSLTNGTQYTFDSIIGGSLAIRSAVDMARRVAGFDSSVLIQGESGTGKELFAQAIHNASGRSEAPFVAINCAAISKTLLESELFGYEEGAFTGARKGGKPGLFETAEGGTVFLDEVSEMDFDLQAKLLRVLQEHKIRRIGGVKEIKTDVRVICACNVDIKQYIADRKFRADLYYRISVAPINVPPLRERREDIPELAEVFLHAAEIQNKRRYVMTDRAAELLMNYTWPGNIRELRNIIEYSAMMARDGVIGENCLPPVLSAMPRELPAGAAAGDSELLSNDFTAGYPQGETLAEMVGNFEKRAIERAVKMHGSTTEGKREAARALGISLSSLYAKLGKNR